jgi:hypothetical protein
MATRISIKPFLSSYVIGFALEELGTDDVTEAVNQIILDHKRGMCACSRAGAIAQSEGADTLLNRAAEQSDLLQELAALPGMSD